MNKHCPICDTQINKTKPYLSMRLDKALQNIVYKLVPGLYTDEMERRRKFQEKNEPTKVPKEELERHFFFCDDKISMSLEYYDTDKSKNNNIKEDSKGSNPNKRYLACPGKTPFLLRSHFCNSIVIFRHCQDPTSDEIHHHEIRVEQRQLCCGCHLQR